MDLGNILTPFLVIVAIVIIVWYYFGENIKKYLAKRKKKPKKPKPEEKPDLKERALKQLIKKIIFEFQYLSPEDNECKKMWELYRKAFGDGENGKV